MPTRITCFIMVLALAAVTYTGCTRTAPPTGDPSICGAITTTTSESGTCGSILVETTGASTYEYDKAWVAITEGSILLLETGENTWTTLMFSNLQVGQEVTVWFTGEVAESYPVQATADTLVVHH